MLTGSPSRILENLTTAVLTFDAELRLTSINPAGEMLFEVSAKKIVGQKLTDLLPQSRRMVKTLHQTLESRHPFTVRGVRLRLPMERTITVDCIVTPLVDSGQETALLVELSQVDRLMRLARDENMLERQAANRAVMPGAVVEGGGPGRGTLHEREHAPEQRDQRALPSPGHRLRGRTVAGDRYHNDVGLVCEGQESVPVFGGKVVVGGV